ncbi:MAG: MBL fold metallo-hydrolase [Desulfobacterales bacterium]|nr:MBL fold metallo-hydrolase [Desulfobacterales bacterium]
MVVDRPGKVTDRIWLVGRRESCAYLVGGEGEYALLGGAMAYVAPDVLDQLDEFGIDENKIRRIVILHSHFDHCGMVPFFKRRWPWAVVTASERGRDLLKKQKVVDGIEMLNRAMIEQNGLTHGGQELDLGFFGMDVEAVVKDGDVLACGDLSLEILEVPGHSSCSIAVYVPEEKALFASDAGGIPFGDKVFTAANSNFDLYQQSLEKMAKLDVEIHLSEHYGALVGEAGRGFSKKAIAAAAETRKMLEAAWAETRDEAKATEAVTNMMMDGVPLGFLPREVVAMVAGQMVRFIAKKMAAA